MLHHKKKIKLLIICIMLMIFSGCWNNRDITKMGIIVGMGIEKVENNELEITIQLIEPNLIEGSVQNSNNQTLRSLSARGSTVFDANRNLLTKVNKKLSYSHLQLMVIGEKLAESGIDDILDFFQRVHEIDKRELLLISKRITPRELFSTESKQSNISTLEILETINNFDKLASIRKISMYDLILNMSKENNSVIGMVSISEKSNKLKISNLDFRGAAVLKKDKLIGWLNPNEVYGLSIVDNKFKNPIITILNPLNQDKKVTLEITKSVAKKNILFDNNRPVLYIEIHMEGKMVEQHAKGDLTSAEQIKSLEAETSKQIKIIVNNTIKNAQQNLHTDIFGFNSIVHRKNLKYWKEVKDNWDDIFSNSSINIKVRYKNKDMGFIKKHK